MEIPNISTSWRRLNRTQCTHWLFLKLPVRMVGPVGQIGSPLLAVSWVRDGRRCQVRVSSTDGAVRSGRGSGINSSNSSQTLVEAVAAAKEQTQTHWNSKSDLVDLFV